MRTLKYFLAAAIVAGECASVLRHRLPPGTFHVSCPLSQLQPRTWRPLTRTSPVRDMPCCYVLCQAFGVCAWGLTAWCPGMRRQLAPSLCEGSMPGVHVDAGCGFLVRNQQRLVTAKGALCWIVCSTACFRAALAE